ncbi:MAG: ABC transporter ATP-binding protein [Magnetococcales bacterium]|nr:ABC transporter ATP-binding protein [Magnetococcales bacterium]
MIDLQSVTYVVEHSGRRLEILKGVDLRVARGEKVALTGPSGSGKSTLLALIAGLEQATSGQVLIDGRDPRVLSEDELARMRRDTMGIVFQDFHLIPTLTAQENVALPLELAGHADARRRAQELLTRVGLGDRLRHHPLELSGGEQQRVAIARAFVTHPPLILADEPTGNLDPGTGREVMELLMRLSADWNSAVLLVTHNPDLAARADRRLHLTGGLLHHAPSGNAN